MRWPGTIQPSRFLSHTGQVLPGVRRVVNVPEPAAGTNLSVTVPAGVQWWVTAAYGTFLASATVSNRNLYTFVSVNGQVVWQVSQGATVVASSTGVFGLQSTSGYTGQTTATFRSIISLPDAPLPQEAEIAVSADGMEADDQFRAMTMWVEEIYVTDAQLSEMARMEAELQRDVAVYEYEQAEQTQGG